MDSARNSAYILILGVLMLNVMVFAHSQMRCAKYDKASGACYAPIRNSAVAFQQEAYLYTNGAPICQSPWTNPISSSYGNGAGCPDYAPCPDPMGNFAAGETFTIMWLARNHAVDDQNPATIFLYLSPSESANQGSDVSAATMKNNLICSGPFESCGGQNGNFVQCYLTCTMPRNTAVGIYTLWWKWDWQGVMYTTCADINVKSGSLNSVATTGAVQPATTAAVIPATTGAIRAATTGASKPATTAAVIPATTGAAIGSTTGASIPPATTGVVISSITTGSGSSSGSGTSHQNCAGSSQVSSSQAQIVTIDTWGSGASSQFRAVIQLKVQEPVLSGWSLEIVFPTNQIQPQISAVFNAGQLQCQSSSPYSHAVIKPVSWSSTIPSGQTLTVEVMGTNRAQLSQSALLANTKVNVYKM